MPPKIVVAVNMTCAHIHCHRANANVVSAINNSLHDLIVIVMRNFGVVYKDLIQVNSFSLFNEIG